MSRVCDTVTIMTRDSFLVLSVAVSPSVLRQSLPAEGLSFEPHRYHVTSSEQMFDQNSQSENDLNCLTLED